MRFGCFSSLVLLASLGLLFLVSVARGAKPESALWTDPAKAAAEDADFAVQGEYVGKGVGLQVVALGDGKFYLSKFKGGLPGAGWDKSAPQAETVDRAGVTAASSGLQREKRSSPNLGKKAPAGADILVGEKVDESLVKGQVKDGMLWAGSETLKEYGDFTMHLEFRLPYKPHALVTSQDRGNSGIYLQNR